MRAVAPWGVLLLAGIALGVGLMDFMRLGLLFPGLQAVIYGEYAVQQFPVLHAHPVTYNLHRAGGVLYLLLGLLQFSGAARRRHPLLHRWCGRLFLACALVLGTSGLAMGLLFPFAGLAETLAVLLFGTLFLLFHLHALGQALLRRFAAHREWMMRGFALGIAISPIRLTYELLRLTGDWRADQALALALWIGWPAALVGAECWIRATRRE